MQFFTVNDDYIDYLKQFSPHVRDNKNETRPYVGVVIKIGEHDYFAPLASPQPKHKNMNTSLDFIKIDKGTLGVINLNNMIPVHNINITPLNIKNIKDSKYQNLLIDQLDWITTNKSEIISKAKILYDIITTKTDTRFHSRSNDFKLLEEKSDEHVKEKLKTPIEKLNEINTRLEYIDNIKKSDLRTKVYDELSQGEYSKKKKELKEISLKHGKYSDIWNESYSRLEIFRNTLLPQNEMDLKVNSHFNELKEERKSLESEKKLLKKENPGLKDNYKKIDREKGMER